MILDDQGDVRILCGFDQPVTLGRALGREPSQAIESRIGVMLGPERHRRNFLEQGSSVLRPFRFSYLWNSRVLSRAAVHWLQHTGLRGSLYISTAMTTIAHPESSIAPGRMKDVGGATESQTTSDGSTRSAGVATQGWQEQGCRNQILEVAGICAFPAMRVAETVGFEPTIGFPL
jgi:hypothetical protein